MAYPLYQFVLPGDVAGIDGTVDGAAQKYQAIRAGGRTALLEDIEAELQAISGTTLAKGRDAAPTWHICCWDPQNCYYPLLRFDLSVEANQVEFARRFTQVQVSWYTIVGNPAASPYTLAEPLKSLVEYTGLPVISYARTDTLIDSIHGYIVDAATAAGSPEAEGSIKVDSLTTANRVNNLNGDVIELAAKAVLIDAARLMKTTPLAGLMLDSEANVAVTPGEISNYVSAADGIDSLTLWPPGGDEYTAVIDDADVLLASLRWHWRRRNWADKHALIARIARAAWSGFTTTMDPLYRAEQFAGLDVIRSWTLMGTIHVATDNGYDAARGHLYRRLAAPIAKVHAGPHIGYTVTDGATTHYRGTPPHILGTAIWSGIAYGSHGMPLWGIHGVFAEGGGYNPNGADVWAMLLRLRQEVTGPLAELLLGWEQTGTRTAMLVSTTDTIYESGRGGDAPAYTNRWWWEQQAARNMWNVLASTGEPFTLLATEDIEAGIPAEYDCLVVPCAFVLTQAEVTAIRAFAAWGKTVICHKGSILETSSIPDLKVLDGHYSNDTNPSTLVPLYTTFGTMTSTQFLDWFTKVRTDLISKMPFDPLIDTDGKRVVVNTMVGGDGKLYLVLVNAQLTPGAEDTWYFGVKGKHLFLDQGADVTIGNPTNFYWTDQVTHQEIRPKESVTIPAGWGRIFELNVPADAASLISRGAGPAADLAGPMKYKKGWSAWARLVGTMPAWHRAI